MGEGRTRTEEFAVSMMEILWTMVEGFWWYNYLLEYLYLKEMIGLVGVHFPLMIDGVVYFYFFF